MVQPQLEARASGFALTLSIEARHQFLGLGEPERRMNFLLSQESFEIGPRQSRELVEDAPAGRQTRKRLRVQFAEFAANGHEDVRFASGEGQASGGPQARPFATGQCRSRPVNDSREVADARFAPGKTFTDLAFPMLQRLDIALKKQETR